jgi:CysZ protein
MTSTGPAHHPDPSDLPPAAPYAAPYVPPTGPPAPQPTPPAGGPAWPAAEQPGTTQHGAQRYLDQTRSLVRGVAGRVRGADQSEVVRRGRDAGMRQVRQVRSTVSAIDTGRLTTTAGQVGRTAAVHGARAARRTVSAITEFGTGIGTFWRGLWTFVTRPLLWLYALLPAAILYGLTIASEAGISVATRRLADWAAGLADDWWAVFRWLIEVTVHWGVSALAYAVLGFLVIPLTLLVGAPFYVLIVRSLERRLAPPGPPARVDWARASGFVMSQTILLTLVVLFGGLVITPILLIPGVNLLAATAIAVVVNGFAIGLIAVGLPLHHRGVSGRREHLRYAWRHRWAIVGFGGMSVLILSIPFAPLRWGSVPAVFVGAVLLHRSFPVVPEPPHAAPMPTAPPFAPGALPYGPPAPYGPAPATTGIPPFGEH